MVKTPILLITFNRPSHVRKVLTEILKQEPQELYICQDGARENNTIDLVKCQEVRDVIKELTSAYAISNKEFRLHTLYQEKNLGCGPGPVAGITWFFNQVEMGIVMEDDCLPHPDFFGYCEELLHRYKNDERIVFINTTLYDDRWQCQSSYDFSHYMVAGAWASWSRALKGFDLDLHSLDARKFRKRMKGIVHSRAEYDWWYFKVLEIQQDTQKKYYWDYQMLIHIYNIGGITIIPNKNLVSNIGFDSEGTNTLCDDGRGNRPVYGILPLKHPEVVKVDVERDYRCFAKKLSRGWMSDILSYMYFSMLYSLDWRRDFLMLYKKIKQKLLK